MEDRKLKKTIKLLKKKKIKFADIPTETQEKVLAYFKAKSVEKSGMTPRKFKNLVKSDIVVPPAEYADQVILARTAMIEMTKAKSELICGHQSFINEKLRVGYVGREVATSNGTYIQTEKGRPFGCVVAVKSRDNNVCIGYSFCNELDKEVEMPVVGLYIAYRRALEGAAAGKVGFESPIKLKTGEVRQLDSNTKAQLKHFEKRALAYFYPEIYSHSRGQKDKKVVYENYDKIHAFQKAITEKHKAQIAAAKAKKEK